MVTDISRYQLERLIIPAFGKQGFKFMVFFPAFILLISVIPVAGPEYMEIRKFSREYLPRYMQVRVILEDYPDKRRGLLLELGQPDPFKRSQDQVITVSQIMEITTNKNPKKQYLESENTQKT
jgi:hypothetical protein